MQKRAKFRAISKDFARSFATHKNALKIILASLVCAILSILLQSCGGDKTPKNFKSAFGSVSSFVSPKISINGAMHAAPREILFNIDLEQNRIFGNAGCNNFSAVVETGVQGRMLVLNHNFTRRICDDEDVALYEFEFLRNLEGEYDILHLEQYKKLLSAYEQIMNPDLFSRAADPDTIVLYNRFKAYFLVPKR